MKFSVNVCQPAAEYLSGEFEAESVEEAVRMLENGEVPLDHEFNDSGAFQYNYEYTLYDEDGAVLEEWSHG